MSIELMHNTIELYIHCTLYTNIANYMVFTLTLKLKVDYPLQKFGFPPNGGVTAVFVRLPFSDRVSPCCPARQALLH
jgi:hypothetical protein